MAIQALGRILCLIFEDYKIEETTSVTVDDFRKLIIDNYPNTISDKRANDVLGTEKLLNFNIVHNQVIFRSSSKAQNH